MQPPPKQPSVIEIHHQTPRQYISTSNQLHNESLSKASLGEIYTEALTGQSFREQCFDYHTEEGIISQSSGGKLNCQSQNMGRNFFIQIEMVLNCLLSESSVGSPVSCHEVVC